MKLKQIIDVAVRCLPTRVFDSEATLEKLAYIFVNFAVKRFKSTTAKRAKVSRNTQRKQSAPPTEKRPAMKLRAFLILTSKTLSIIVPQQ